MRLWRFGLITTTAIAGPLLLAGCSSGDTASSSSTTGTATTTSVAAQAHNAADVAFAQGMIPHHQQAVEMSDLILGKSGIDPRVVDLATRIKAAQGPEIERMNGWLAQWSVGSPASTTAMPDHGTQGHDAQGHDAQGHDMPGMSMPATNTGAMPSMAGHGMVSEAGMTELRTAQGAAASRLFLTDMIAHHRGAIMMANQEIEQGQYPPAVELARSIVAGQSKEITEMEQILASQ